MRLISYDKKAKMILKHVAGLGSLNEAAGFFLSNHFNLTLFLELSSSSLPVSAVFLLFLKGL